MMDQSKKNIIKKFQTLKMPRTCNSVSRNCVENLKNPIFSPKVQKNAYILELKSQNFNL